MQKLEIISMIRINGEWKNQEEIPPDEFKNALEKKLNETMRNIGFQRKNAA